MKKKLIGLTSGLVVLGMVGAAQAANVVVDGSFEATTEFISTPVYNGAVGTWLTNGPWTVESPGAYDGSNFAQIGTSTYQHFLYQVIDYSGAAGTIIVDYAIKLPGINFQLYGSNTKPLVGASLADSGLGLTGWGTQIRSSTISGGSPGWLDWGHVEFNSNNDYQWYTVLFKGATNSAVDNISVNIPSAVPVPGAVWLLGSGFVGLVGLRRRKK